MVGIPNGFYLAFLRGESSFITTPESFSQGEKSVGIDRFGEVAVGFHLGMMHLAADDVFGGGTENSYGQVLKAVGSTDDLEDFGAITLGKVEIEDDQVRALSLGKRTAAEKKVDGFFTIGRDDRLSGPGVFLLERQTDQMHVDRIIFDDEDAGRLWDGIRCVHDAFSATGRVNQKVAPTSGWASAHMRPW